ncbi:MAG: PadR family transcriptional regulator [Candidatus Aminicenantes bacterium]|nr:PadR family transcriptional regulator [Candidatus Aminicenantes bacterium]
MLTIIRLKEPAYLVNIRSFLHENTGKDWAFGSLNITLNKMKKKGYVTTYTGKPKHTQGGKAIQYYKLTDKGYRALIDAKQLHDNMYEGFSILLSEKTTHEK